MADEPVAPATEPAQPATAPSPAPTQPTEPPKEPPVTTSNSPLSPHRSGKNWDGMKELFDKRDKKPESNVPRRTAPQKSSSPEKTTTPPPPTPAPTKTVSSEPSSDPVQQLLTQQPPDNFDEKSKIGWNQFKEKWHGLYKNAQEEVSKLQKQLAEREGLTKKERGELEEKLKKAQRYEYAFDIQADPEFRKKFIEPANKVYKELNDTLKRAGHGDTAADQINWDDEIAVEAQAMELQNKHGAAVANVFRNKAAELRSIRSEFAEARSNAITNYDSIIAEKQKERELKSTEREGIIKNTFESILSEKLEDGNLKWAFLHRKEAPANADKVTLEAINQHNALVEESRKRIDALSREDDPSERVKLAVAAEVGLILSHERPILVKQIQELEKQLEEIQKGRAAPSSVPRTPTQPAVRYPRKASMADSFAEKFKQ